MPSARCGGLDWQAAARAASVLQIVARLIEGGELEKRLSRLEQALADREAAELARLTPAVHGNGISVNGHHARP